MKRPLFLPLAFTLLITACAFQGAQPVPLIPRRLLFDNPVKTDPQISPDGKFLAYLAPDRNDVLQIWLRSMHGGDDRQLTAEPKRGIRHYTWSYDRRHLLFARETDGDENWQIIALDMVTGSERNLTPYPGVRSFLIGMSHATSQAVLIAMNLRTRRLFDIYRVDLDSGETRMVNRNGGAQSWWVADDRLNVRIAAAFAGTIVRERRGRPWRVVRKWHPGEQSLYLGLSADGHNIFMSGSHNGELSALLSLNLDSGEETVLASDPQYDVQDAFVHPITHAIQAVGFYKDELEWQVLDPSVADDFARLKAFHRGEMNVLHPPDESPILYSRNLGRRDLADKTWIVSYESDDTPVRYYAYDREKKTLRVLFDEYPELEKHRFPAMKPVAYPSRDGLTIHGYLTLPLDRPPHALPAVLLVHGGPWLRDRWGFHNTVHWLADRGYAVLQINYRGSAGYGRKFVQAGYKEWGGKMHDDLIDGVNWLVKEGIADPRKMAIMGGSYGGFAALAGVTLTPEVFVAGVSNVGISNLLTHYETYPPYWFKARFRVRVGDPNKDAEMLKARSPLSHVDSIKAPLLIAHGANDVRVNVHESEQMVAAMRASGKPVEYYLYPDEGHRQWRPENKLNFYAKAERFLAKYLGGSFEAASEPDAATPGGE